LASLLSVVSFFLSFFGSFVRLFAFFGGCVCVRKVEATNEKIIKWMAGALLGRAQRGGDERKKQ
jgi:hypothetical protein